MSDVVRVSCTGKAGRAAPERSPLARAPAAGRRLDWYRAYTEWRRQHPRQESTRFFRGNRKASLIWMLVMRGHYLGDPPSLTECFAEARCARGTARAILRAATARGYFVLSRAPDDHRRTLIHPSRLCIAEFQRMVDTYLRLSETLQDGDRAAERHYGRAPERHDSRAAERHDPPGESALRWYAAYARWRLERKRSAPIRPSCKFFRRSRDHTEIWMTVMHGHYSGTPPTIGDCLAGIRCSRDTGRKIILEAESAGFLALDTDVRDSRKRHVRPTARSVSEYEAMVDTFLALGDVLHYRESA